MNTAHRENNRKTKTILTESQDFQLSYNTKTYLLDSEEENLDLLLER